MNKLGKRLLDDLDQEIREHIELATQENIDRGMAPEEARYAAMRKFGNVTRVKEDAREVWTLVWVEQFVQDIRFALRQLRKSTAFTAIAILTLALGIGANTAIFSAANALLLNPYPFPQPNRIVSLEARHISGKNGGTGFRDFLDWRKQNAVFEDMAILPWTGAYSWTGQGEPRRVVGGSTTAGFLRVLGIQPVIGRWFTPDEDTPGGPQVAVLSYPAWRRLFGGSDEILGRSITLDGRSFTIIGVLSSRFSFPGMQNCDFFTPLQENPLQGRYQHQYAVVARMKPGIPLARAQSEMMTIARRLEEEYPETNKGWGISVLPISRALAEHTRAPLTVLFSAVGFVLLLTCVNLASLLLARASARTQEMALRASLGATRRRIVCQLLTESVLLSVTGGAAGLLVAQWLIGVLRAAAPEDMGLDASFHLDPLVLVFALIVSLVTGVCFGLIPALYASRSNLSAPLKGDWKSWFGAASRTRLHSLLVAGEMALSLVLLAAAGLVVKDLIVVLHMNTGLRVDHVLTFYLDPPNGRYQTPQRSHALYDQLQASLKRAPGIDAVATVDTLPMTGGMTGGSFEIDGRPKPADWVDTLVQYNSASPGYFRAMGIPVLLGRDFDEQDAPASMPVAIINDTLARQFFPNEDPLGHTFKDDYDGSHRTIIGVVGSIKNQQPMRPPIPSVYAPYTQKGTGGMWLTVRTSGDPIKVASLARSTVRSIEPDILVLKMRTMRQVVSESLNQQFLVTTLLGSFAVFALLLAIIGVYGITAYSVSQRVHEMGIRMAMGASRRDIFLLVLRRGIVLALSGVAVGIPLALVISQLLRSMLYGISSRDLTVFLGVPVLLVGVAVLASCIPARRASRVDPIAALRYE